MKKHAQAILQFTGYPLEPIVALEIQKSYQAQLLFILHNTAHRSIATAQPGLFLFNTDMADERWFGNYE